MFSVIRKSMISIFLTVLVFVLSASTTMAQVFFNDNLGKDSSTILSSLRNQGFQPIQVYSDAESVYVFQFRSPRLWHDTVPVLGVGYVLRSGQVECTSYYVATHDIKALLQEFLKMGMQVVHNSEADTTKTIGLLYGHYYLKVDVPRRWEDVTVVSIMRKSP